MDQEMNNDESSQPERDEVQDEALASEEDASVEGDGAVVDEALADVVSEDSIEVVVEEEPLTPEEALAEANAKVLRVTAEIENARKRMQKEVSDARKYAATGLIRDILGAMDNLGRAISAATEEEANGGIASGVEMVLQQLEQILNQHGCQKIHPKGEQFDPNRHEAASQLPSDEFDAGTIMEVLQDGYQLHERVVRPAQVIISLGSVSGSDEEETESSQAGDEQE